MIDRAMMKRLREVNDLPTLPEVMSKILKTAADDNASAREMTSLLERDHTLAARTLKLANSPFYGLRSKVDSIKRAVVVIGFDEVRQIALATSVLQAFGGRYQFALDAEDFWAHSMGSAKATQIIIDRCPGVIDASEALFTGGLLHDIGKFILALVLREEYPPVVLEAGAEKRVLYEIEKEHFNTHNGEIGGWLADKWRFPPIITRVVRSHYRDPAIAGPGQPEIAVIVVASDMARVAGFGAGGDGAPHPHGSASAKFLGLSTGDLRSVIEELKAMRDDVLEFLSASASEAA